MRSSWGAFMRVSALVISLAAFVLSLLSLTVTRKRQHEMKTIDLMRSFQDRYDKLVFEAADQVKNGEEAERFFYRYWNLQLEQYEYWKQGYIDDRVYAYWMAFRRAEYKEDEKLFKRHPAATYKQGWEKAKELLKLDLHPIGDFQEFIEEVFDKNDKNAKIAAILRKYR